MIEVESGTSQVHLLVNATSARSGGGLSFLRQQIPALIRTGPEHQISVLTAPWNHQELSGVPGAAFRRLSIRSATQRYLFEQCILPFEARCDLLYYPANFGPLVTSRRPNVVTIQNANYFGTGALMAHNRSIPRRLKIEVSRRGLRSAAAVVAVSRSLLDELAGASLKLARVEVVPLGRPSWPAASSRPADVPPNQPYFLSIAADYPHKRLDDLVRAWALLPADRCATLVMVGTASPDRVCRWRRDLRPGRNLVHLANVTDRSQIRWLYEHAMTTVVPSALESYSLAPVEALSLGCPVICSDIPVHREMLGSRARYFVTGDIGELRSQLATVEPRVAKHASATVEYLQAWPSWDESALTMWRIFQVALGGKPRN